MKRIPLYAYISANNPYGGAEVLKRFNIQFEPSRMGIARGLRYLMVTQGEDGFREIAKVHPDRELILDSHQVEEVVTVPEKTSGACGCQSNANGEESPNNTPNQELLDEIKELKTKEQERSNKETIASEVQRALGETKPFIEKNLPYIALGGVALFFIYKSVNK